MDENQVHDSRNGHRQRTQRLRWQTQSRMVLKNAEAFQIMVKGYRSKRDVQIVRANINPAVKYLNRGSIAQDDLSVHTP